MNLSDSAALMSPDFSVIGKKSQKGEKQDFDMINCDPDSKKVR